MAAGPLYITRPRLDVVDFSRPYMHIEATLLQMRTKKDNGINTLSDLLSQSDIKYGMIKSGMLVRSFRSTNNSLYRSLWTRMRDFTPTVFTDTNEQGIQRVRESGGKYAFVLPTIIGEYIIRQSPCDLTMMGKFVMRRAYGLAVPKGSGLLKQVNRALDILEQNKVLDHLYEKWWIKRSACNGIHSSKIYSLNSSTAVTTQHNSLFLYHGLFLSVMLFSVQ